MLWTDRYRPKRFVDLLGDEVRLSRFLFLLPARLIELRIVQRLHRTALLWLKEWDACVFKGTAKANAAAELKRERSKKRAREGGGGFGENKFAGKGEGGSAPQGDFGEAVRLLFPLISRLSRPC